MDVTDIDWLRSAEGIAATERAATLLAEGGELAAQRRLGDAHGRAHARALVALIEGRGTASAKFADADVLFCDRESAEQASSDVVANQTAARFTSFERVADLGSGMGGDTLALARHTDVTAVDRDPTRLAMLRANADVRGIAGCITATESEIEGWSAEGVDAIWIDPARRDARGRSFDPERWSPPLSHAIALAQSVPAAGIKLAPGIDSADLPLDAADTELEFISLDGRLVEAVLWLGALATSPRRATILSSAIPAPVESLDGEPDTGATEIGEPGTYLYDPDPGIGRASLIDALAARIGGRKLNELVAYLTADEQIASPFVRRFRIHEWMAFSERTLIERLRALGANRVDVMRRASPVDTNALERRINAALGGGPTLLTVALTLVGEQRVALIVERERD